MRILFHHRIASADGQAVHIEELIAALRQQGHEVILVGPADFLARGFGGANPFVARLKRALPAAVFELLEVVYNVKAFWRLLAAVRRHRPDVIYERFSLFLFAGIWVRQLTGVKLLLEVNAPLFEERAAHDGLRLHALGRRAQQMLWRRADHVFSVTEVLARRVVSYGVSRERLTVMANGIDPQRFAVTTSPATARRALGLPERLVLGFTGFIRGWNAVHGMIDFAARHADTFDLHVLVVGDGPARESLRCHAKARGIAERLTITGTVARADVARHVAAFDIAVLPGLTPYSSPLKLFEYLQLGRAIVAPDAENIREVLTDGQDALLFDPAAQGAMESALLRLCQDPALRGRLGRAGPQTIQAKSLTWGRNAARVAAIAEELAATTIPNSRPIQDHRMGERSATHHVAGGCDG